MANKLTPTAARVAAVAAMVAAVAIPGAVASTGTAPPVVVHEDSGEWDCRTMGNRVCGHV